MAKAQINGIEMYYELHGEGQPLVLIPGYRANMNKYLTVIEPLAQNFQVLLLDNRGSGQTDAPDEPYSIEQMAGDAMGLIEHLGLEKANVLGTSMGGAIVQTMAHKYADKLGRCILSCTSPKFRKPFATYDDAMIQLEADGVNKEAALRILFSWVFANKMLSDTDTLNQIIEFCVNDPNPMTATGIKNQKIALNHFDSHRWLEEIKIPCLILAGREDIITPTFEAEYLAEKIPNAKLHIFDECGHAPQSENTEEFLDVVTNFLS